MSLSVMFSVYIPLKSTSIQLAVNEVGVMLVAAPAGMPSVHSAVRVMVDDTSLLAIVTATLCVPVVPDLNVTSNDVPSFAPSAVIEAFDAEKLLLPESVMVRFSCKSEPFTFMRYTRGTLMPVMPI